MTEKSLMNCDTKEFLKQMNALKNDIAKFFKLTKLSDVLYKSDSVPDGVTDEEKEKILNKQYAERYDNIISACFGEHIDTTYEIIAKVHFTEVAEVEKWDVNEVVGALMAFLTNSRTMPFFITWRSSGLLTSDE